MSATTKLEGALTQLSKVTLKAGNSTANQKALSAAKQGVREAKAELTAPDPAPPAPSPEPPAPVPVPPAPAPTPDIFNGSSIQAFTESAMRPGAVVEVPDPLGSGRKVFAFTVRDDDVAPLTPTDNPRAQLGSPYVIQSGKEIWARTRLLIPEDFPSWSNWMTLFSIYGPPFNGSGPVHLESYGQTLEWGRSATYHEDTPWSTPLVKGQWMDLMWHMLMSPQGWVELYYNGAQQILKPSGGQPTQRLAMATYDKPNNGGPNNVRIEQYRAKGAITTPATLYFDGMFVGTTRASVGG